MQKLIYDAAFPFSILGENGELVAYCDDDGLSEIERKDAARRIVACVNACAGIPTSTLDATPSIENLWGSVLQQRDELLAALCEVSVSARLGVTKMTPELLLFIDAAIAKVQK